MILLLTPDGFGEELEINNIRYNPNWSGKKTPFQSISTDVDHLVDKPFQNFPKVVINI
ncbi:MAG: hypothetical protein NZ879_06020 [Archaeoglobaceae archaeon]|nr:hypothetical protein [Archaeoglobaceae archaeon]MDW8118524.1 hypothetical protein [Archaeoglobaceae archaeon]